MSRNACSHRGSSHHHPRGRTPGPSYTDPGASRPAGTISVSLFGSDTRHTFSSVLCLVLHNRFYDDHLFYVAPGGRYDLVNDDRCHLAVFARDDGDGFVDHGVAVGPHLFDDFVVGLVLGTYVDTPARQSGRETRVLPLFADRQRELLIVNDDRRDALFFIEANLANARGLQGGLGELDGVVAVGHDVDAFRAQFVRNVANP